MQPARPHAQVGVIHIAKRHEAEIVVPEGTLETIGGVIVGATAVIAVIAAIVGVVPNEVAVANAGVADVGLNATTGVGKAVRSPGSSSNRK